MNKLFPYSLPYAETHYKFKLPWSPLFRKHPEIFLDGPSFCVPGVQPVFYLAVKDADYFPVRILTIELLIQGEKQSRKATLDVKLAVDQNLCFIPLAIDFSGLEGKLSINGKISVEYSGGKAQSFLNCNFPSICTFWISNHLYWFIRKFGCNNNQWNISL